MSRLSLLGYTGQFPHTAGAASTTRHGVARPHDMGSPDHTAWGRPTTRHGGARPHGMGETSLPASQKWVMGEANCLNQDLRICRMGCAGAYSLWAAQVEMRRAMSQHCKYNAAIIVETHGACVYAITINGIMPKIRKKSRHNSINNFFKF